MSLLQQIGISLPIIQAPMAGVSTPELAAAVSNAGGLGSLGVGATHAKGAHEMITVLKALTDKPFNINLFVHAAPKVDPQADAAWLQALAPQFTAFGAEPPSELRTIYQSFAEDEAMFTMLLEARPRVISFHFGLPQIEKIRALQEAGCLLIASATNLDEAKAIEAAGLDAIIAQGFEAGGHRGVFDPTAKDDQLSTFALTQVLTQSCALPVIAAGGIMDGNGIASMLALGAEAAQLGTAFVACPESQADAAYRAALRGDGAHHTVMTSAISGRPARAVSNRFTAWAADEPALRPPDYPRAYDAGKALHAAAKAHQEFGFGAQWAGQGAPLARSLPAADLVRSLFNELNAARAYRSSTSFTQGPS